MMQLVRKITLGVVTIIFSFASTFLTFASSEVQLLLVGNETDYEPEFIEAMYRMYESGLTI